MGVESAVDWSAGKGVDFRFDDDGGCAYFGGRR